MSEKWRYQIKVGLIYGFFMAIALTMFEAIEKGFSAFLNWKFFVRLTVMVLLGVFLIGYLNWKQKEKQKGKG